MKQCSQERFSSGIVVSISLHILLVVFVVFSPALFPAFGEASWGSEKENEAGMRVKVVSRIAGVPLPSPAVVTEGAVANESLGFYESNEATLARALNPAADEGLSDPDLIPVGSRLKDENIEKTTADQKANDNRPDNSIPFGQGGRPSINYGSAGAEGTGIEAIGGGEFGELYSSYVESITRRISQNWLQSTVDINLKSAPRIYIVFSILRDGTITDVEVTESSGNRSLDRSAQRAVFASTPLAPLPSGYRGRRIDVNFWFEFTKQ